MKKKPTVVERPQESSSVVDVLESMLSSEPTRQLMGTPGVRVLVSIDPDTGRRRYSFRSPDYVDEPSPKP